MAFNINNMISEGLKGGVAKTAHFEVFIQSPPSLGFDTEKTRELAFRADSVELPGRTALTIDHKFTVNGPINKIPYTQIYPDVTITFICSEDFREKEYLDLWMSKMLDTSPNPSGAFNVRYFDDYKSTIVINQFDQSGNIRTATKLFDAYPIIINGIQMGWQDDAIARVSAQFSLRYYEVERFDVPETQEKTEVPNIKDLGFKFDGKLIT